MVLEFELSPGYRRSLSSGKDFRKPWILKFEKMILDRPGLIDAGAPSNVCSEEVDLH